MSRWLFFLKPFKLSQIPESKTSCGWASFSYPWVHFLGVYKLQVFDFGMSIFRFCRSVDWFLKIHSKKKLIKRSFEPFLSPLIFFFLYFSVKMWRSVDFEMRSIVELPNWIANGCQLEKRFIFSEMIFTYMLHHTALCCAYFAIKWIVI